MLDRVARQGYFFDRRHHHLSKRISFLFIFVISENVFISIRRPEAPKKFRFAQVTLFVLINALEENLNFFFFQTYVEPNQGLLKLLKADCCWTIRVDHFKALLNGNVVVHEVVADFLKNSAFPLTCELRIGLVKDLLNSFKCRIKSFIVKLFAILLL